MADRRRGSRSAIAAAVAIVALAGCDDGQRASSTATAGTAACRGGALRGSFAVVRGSAGAGQIVYRLRLTNESGSRCVLRGIPQLRLLDANGKPLPTKLIADRQGALAPKRIVLAAGGSASATARFSPDVPGVGEGTTGRCEPVAARLRVTPAGGGSLEVPVRPPTPVCEHGRLAFRAISASA